MILLTGATGKAGSEVAKQLAANNIPFRVLVRDPDKAATLKDLGAEIAVGDMADAEAVSKALTGAEKAVLIISNGEHQLTLEKQFTDCAVAAGVKHLGEIVFDGIGSGDDQTHSQNACRLGSLYSGVRT